MERASSRGWDESIGVDTHEVRYRDSGFESRA